jgi:molecular chaperone IbpA
MRLATINDYLPAQFKDSVIGFDKMFEQFDRHFGELAKQSSYPPYNIVKVDDNTYRLEFAVAGFGKHDIDIELDGNTLTIRGNVQSEVKDTPEGDTKGAWQFPFFIHRGIANRAFTRSFTIADSVQIKNAELTNGLLRIVLENLAQFKQAKKIEIK